MTRPAIQIIRDEHAAVASVLNSMLQVIERAPTPVDERFFDVLRAMLFYIDEFPERRHHPKESELLFPKIDRAVPALRPVLQRLEDDHVQGESRVRALHHLMLAWELLGEGRRQAFQQAAREYVDFYLAHMRIEEVEILPAAQNVLSDADWEELDQAFQNHGDPLAGAARDPEFDPLFARIVTLTPAPFGVGPELQLLACLRSNLIERAVHAWVAAREMQLDLQHGSWVEAVRKRAETPPPQKIDLLDRFIIDDLGAGRG